MQSLRSFLQVMPQCCPFVECSVGIEGWICDGEFETKMHLVRL